MNSKFEGWVNTIAYSSAFAGLAFFTGWAGGVSAKVAGIGAGVTFFGTLTAHFKTAPTDTTITIPVTPAPIAVIASAPPKVGI